MPAEPSCYHNNDAQEENNYNVACPSCGARATCPLSAWVLWEAAWDEEADCLPFHSQQLAMYRERGGSYR